MVRVTKVVDWRSADPRDSVPLPAEFGFELSHAITNSTGRQLQRWRRRQLRVRRPLADRRTRLDRHRQRR
jgi:hypothetical protein